MKTTETRDQYITGTEKFEGHTAQDLISSGHGTRTTDSLTGCWVSQTTIDNLVKWGNPNGGSW